MPNKNIIKQKEKYNNTQQRKSGFDLNRLADFRLSMGIFHAEEIIFSATFSYYTQFLKFRFATHLIRVRLLPSRQVWLKLDSESLDSLQKKRPTDLSTDRSHRGFSPFCYSHSILRQHSADVRRLPLQSRAFAPWIAQTG